MARLSALLLSFCLFLMPLGAVAQTTATATAGLSPLSATTVAGFVSACRQDKSACDAEIGQALMDKMVYDGSQTLCLPDVNYVDAVPGWLSSHPETRAMSVEDGIYQALRTLYACH